MHSKKFPWTTIIMLAAVLTKTYASSIRILSFHSPRCIRGSVVSQNISTRHDTGNGFFFSKSTAFSTDNEKVNKSRSLISRSMTTAYSGEAGDGTLGLEKLKYLPFEITLKDGTEVEIGPFKESEWSRGMELMNLIIREGKTWPFVDEFETVDAYRSYFLSHAAFVVRSTGTAEEEILGCFYIKPNYPGRCSHICNGGFITAPEHRRKGVATVMGKAFCKFAKDLGYKSSYFNLVFRSNKASVGLWEKLNFERVATLEKAAKLEGVEGLDTAYGYRFDLEKLNDDFEITGD